MVLRGRRGLAAAIVSAGRACCGTAGEARSPAAADGAAAGAGGSSHQPAEWGECPLSSAVERLPYKQDVAGSNPAAGISRSQAGSGIGASQGLDSR